MNGEELRLARCLTCGAAVIDFMAGSCHECGAEDRHIGPWQTVPDDQRPLASLAAPSTPEPSGLREAAQDIVTAFVRHPGWTLEHDSREADALREALRAAPSTEPALDATLLHRAIVMTLPFEKWISPETAASIAAEYARLAESQP